MNRALRQNDALTGYENSAMIRIEPWTGGCDGILKRNITCMVVQNDNRFLLSEVDEEGRYSVIGLEGDDLQRRRLQGMGFAVGAPLFVVACPADGMVVVKVAGCRMALSPGTTKYIAVKRKV